jgi:hypothetical protein
VYLNALGLLLRLYVRGEIGPAKERLKIFLDELKNEVLYVKLETLLISIRRCRLTGLPILFSRAFYKYKLNYKRFIVLTVPI